MATYHEVSPLPEYMVRGYFDCKTKPILSLKSGDTVSLIAWNSADEEDLPPDRSVVDERHVAALDQLERGPASHMVTGPIYVKNAEPGDVLQIDILQVSLHDEWGFIGTLPGRGALPDEFQDPAVIHASMNKEEKTARLPWGKELPLSPFFGILAVAPAPELGRCSTLPPGPFGGNMDNKELIAGSVLYLPIYNVGGLFFAGDGHAAQGDGEVCLTAIETSLSGTFRLTARKDLGFCHPFAETPTHLISIGLNEYLDLAASQAVAEMIDHICRRTDLSRHDAYMLCSIAGDLHVTQIVNGVKGCHMLLSKSNL